MHAGDQYRDQNTHHRGFKTGVQIGEDTWQCPVQRHAVKNTRHRRHQRVDGRRPGQQQPDTQPVFAELAHHLTGKSRDRHRRIQQMHVIGRVHHHVFHLMAERRAVQRHAHRHATQPKRHRPWDHAGGAFDLRRHRRDQLTTDEHKHRHADQAEYRKGIAQAQRAAEPAFQRYRMR
ncbi:hypothetical protein D3C71_1608610 [compost metagenome]